jgi:hypothetical protein
MGMAYDGCYKKNKATQQITSFTAVMLIYQKRNNEIWLSYVFIPFSCSSVLHVSDGCLYKQDVNRNDGWKNVYNVVFYFITIVNSEIMKRKNYF